MADARGSAIIHPDQRINTIERCLKTRNVTIKYTTIIYGPFLSEVIASVMLTNLCILSLPYCAALYDGCFRITKPATLLDQSVILFLGQ